MEIKVHKYDNDKNNYYCKNSKKKTYTEKTTRLRIRRKQFNGHNWNDKASGLSPFLEITHHQKERNLEEYICTLGFLTKNERLLSGDCHWVWEHPSFEAEQHMSIETIWFLIHVQGLLGKKTNHNTYCLWLIHLEVSTMEKNKRSDVHSLLCIRLNPSKLYDLMEQYVIQTKSYGKQRVHPQNLR